MSMTRKHYEAVAASIKEVADNHRKEGQEAEFLTIFETADKLADKFRRENARFDKQRFMSACGV